MNADIAALPLAAVAAISLVADSVVPADWAPLVGSLSAAGAVIYTVNVMLKRQREAAEECSATIAKIVDANSKTNELLADQIAAMAKEMEARHARKDPST